MKLPIWSVYLLVPAFMLLAGSGVIIRSEGPGVLAAMMVGIGLVSALIFHGYCFIKGKVLKVLGEDK